jgi:hypothetical protein
MNDDWKGILFCLILAICIVFPLWYFGLGGGQAIESWSIADSVRNDIIIDDGYEINYINVAKYSEDWWYISIHLTNQSSGKTSWTLLRYNSIDDRYEYDALYNLTIR